MNTLIPRNILLIKMYDQPEKLHHVKCWWKTKTKNLLIFDFFTEIIVAEHGICDHDFSKEIKILVKIFVFCHSI